MAEKKDTKKFDVWIRRVDTFTATIEADTLEQALELAKTYSIDELSDAPGENIDSEHRFTAVIEV
jgi:hypothetical protein